MESNCQGLNIPIGTGSGSLTNGKLDINYNNKYLSVNNLHPISQRNEVLHNEGNICAKANNNSILIDKHDDCLLSAQVGIKLLSSSNSAHLSSIARKNSENDQIHANIHHQDQESNCSRTKIISSSLKSKPTNSVDRNDYLRLQSKQAITQTKSPSLSSSFTPLIRFILLATLIGQQNAPFCLGFPDAHSPDYFGLVSYNDNTHLNDRSTLMPNHQYRPQRTLMRQLIVDEHSMPQTLPTSPDSLTRDHQLESLPSSASFSGWTSMFGNSFGNSAQDSLDTHIQNILVPRVSGTPGNVQVRDYIVNVLKANNYHIELDTFAGSTPQGKVEFANIIATSNPNSCRQLVLAAHYDSKLQDGFLGATDSAVPCAMLLRMAETFNRSFRQEESVNQSSGGDDASSNKDPISLRFIFFDGEEAFRKWSPSDSLYGSRHLAAKWQRQSAPQRCSAKSELNLIELFVLLDLIGTKDTSFVMYNRQLRQHYNSLKRYERSYLTKAGLSQSRIKDEIAFTNGFVPLDFVEDDHVPFKQRGVPILSLLAHPFPQVWHKNDDNYTAIDFPRTRRILHVLEEFLSNYQ